MDAPGQGFFLIAIDPDSTEALSLAAGIYLKLGDDARATALYEESLTRYRAIGDAWGTAMVQFSLGGLWLEAGELARAEPLLAPNLELARRVGHRWLLGATLCSLGMIAIYHYYGQNFVGAIATNGLAFPNASALPFPAVMPALGLFVTTNPVVHMIIALTFLAAIFWIQPPAVLIGTRNLFAWSFDAAAADVNCGKEGQPPCQFTAAQFQRWQPGLCATGEFFDPIDGGTCWTCPAGYARTVFSVTSDKACEKASSSNFSVAQERGKGTGWLGTDCQSGQFWDIVDGNVGSTVKLRAAVSRDRGKTFSKAKTIVSSAIDQLRDRIFVRHRHGQPADVEGAHRAGVQLGQRRVAVDGLIARRVLAPFPGAAGGQGGRGRHRPRAGLPRG